MIGRRVVTIDGRLGTVVAGPFRRARRGQSPRWQVDWDEPTPYQATARPDIPSDAFRWADESPPAEGDDDG